MQHPPDKSKRPFLRLHSLVSAVLALGLLWFGFHLLYVKTFTLKDITFSGVSLHLLALSTFSLAGFAFINLHDVRRGTLQPPPSWHDTYDAMRDYKYAVIERRWPFLVVAFGSLALAFVLA